MDTPNENKGIFLHSQLVRAETKLKLLDRIRVLFGARLFVNVRVDMQRRQKIQHQTKYGVEAVFGTRVRKDMIPILFDGFEDNSGLLHE